MTGEPHPTLALCLALLRLLHSEKQIQNTWEKNSSEPRMKKKDDALIPGDLELQKRDPSLRTCGSSFLSGFQHAFKVLGSGIGAVKLGRSNSSAARAVHNCEVIGMEKSEKIK